MNLRDNVGRTFARLPGSPEYCPHRSAPRAEPSWPGWRHLGDGFAWVVRNVRSLARAVRLERLLQRLKVSRRVDVVGPQVFPLSLEVEHLGKFGGPSGGEPFGGIFFHLSHGSLPW